MRRALPVAAACLALAGCGPRTVVSMLFPTRYAATTVVDFDDRGQVTRQTVVSRCKTIDQTDSIAANSLTRVVGERHWLRRGDGSIWLVGLLDVCRWGVKGPRGEQAFKPIQPDVAFDDRRAAWPLGVSYSYRFDDPDNPTLLDVYRTRALFEEGAEGLRLTARIAPVGDAATDTLAAAFPFLARVETLDAAARQANKDIPAHRRASRLSPGTFMGVSARAEQLRGGACATPDPKAVGPIRLQSRADCRFGSECRPGREATQLCHETLGGLRPAFAAGYATVRFALDEGDPAYVYGLVRGEVLRDSGAPNRSAAPGHFDWNPQICLDGLCFRLERMGEAIFYYPSRNVVVEVRQASHTAYASLFLAREAPVWSGTD